MILLQNNIKKKTGSANNDNWFLEESIKFGKGYSKPGEYLQAIAKIQWKDLIKIIKI